MLLTNKLLAAQRDAARRVAEGRTYSVALPIVGRVPVPSPRQLAVYGALAGLAALELIDWPVAVAMGVGSALVSRRLTEMSEREDEIAAKLAEPTAPAAAGPTAEAPAKKAPAKKAPAKKAPAKTPVAKKSPAKKAPAKKAPARKTPGKTPPPRG